MYKQQKAQRGTIKGIKTYDGETIEQKINRITNNKEPIKDGAPLIYTDRKNGVEPQYNIRTDRFELAVEAMDAVSKTHRAKREERHKTVGEQAKEGMTKEGGEKAAGAGEEGKA